MTEAMTDALTGAPSDAVETPADAGEGEPAKKKRGRPKKVAASETKPEAVTYRVRARQPVRRRAGLAFDMQWRKFEHRELTPAQVRALKSDPVIEIEEL